MLDCLAGLDEPALPLHVVGPDGLEGLSRRLPPGAAAFLPASGFGAKAQEVALLPGGENGLAGAVLGLGDAAAHPIRGASAPCRTSCRRAACGASPSRGNGPRRPCSAGASAPTASRGSSRPSGSRRGSCRRRERERAAGTAAAAWRARDLINTPANLLGPAELAEAVAESWRRAHGARCSVIKGDALAEGFPALATVGRASTSARAPRVAVLEWGEPGHPLVALCGKGVCFDTGGLDLKPSAAMLRMKKDMGGAAVALGVAEAVMRARLPVRLLLLVGAVENAVSGDAFRPMDVLRTRAGLTVEVGNTDAEGRLVLADLLAFAAERKPELLLDFATLTGAARVALGPDLPALFTPDDCAGRGAARGRPRRGGPAVAAAAARGLRGMARQPGRRPQQRQRETHGGRHHRRVVSSKVRSRCNEMGPSRPLCLERQFAPGPSGRRGNTGNAGRRGIRRNLLRLRHRGQAGNETEMRQKLCSGHCT